METWRIGASVVWWLRKMGQQQIGLIAIGEEIIAWHDGQQH